MLISTVIKPSFNDLASDRICGLESDSWIPMLDVNAGFFIGVIDLANLACFEEVACFETVAFFLIFLSVSLSLSSAFWLAARSLLLFSSYLARFCCLFAVRVCTPMQALVCTLFRTSTQAPVTKKIVQLKKFDSTLLFVIKNAFSIRPVRTVTCCVENFTETVAGGQECVDFASTGMR